MNNKIKELKELVEKVDQFPWYWISYGEKCYAFAVVEAYPVCNGDPPPIPGTELIPDEDDINIWVGENGIKMFIDSEVCHNETQTGLIICQFIAKAIAYFKECEIDNDTK